MDPVHGTFFYGIWPMGRKDISFIDKINLIFIALTMRAIQHCLSAWKTGEFRVLPELDPGSGVQQKCNTRNITHVLINACRDVFCHLEEGFLSSSPEVQHQNIYNIRSKLC